MQNIVIDRTRALLQRDEAPFPSRASLERSLSPSIEFLHATGQCDFHSRSHKSRVPLTDHRDLRRGALHFSRSSFLWQNTCSQRIQVQNYDPETVMFELILELEADFADIFEVRGFQRANRGNQSAGRTKRNNAALPWPRRAST
jgi:hypothetical protein